MGKQRENQGDIMMHGIYGLCIYIYIYLCIYKHIYINIYIYILVHTYTCICMIYVYAIKCRYSILQTNNGTPMVGSWEFACHGWSASTTPWCVRKATHWVGHNAGLWLPFVCVLGTCWCIWIFRFTSFCVPYVFVVGLSSFNQCYLKVCWCWSSNTPFNFHSSIWCWWSINL